MGFFFDTKIGFILKIDFLISLTDLQSGKDVPKTGIIVDTYLTSRVWRVRVDPAGIPGFNNTERFEQISDYPVS